MDSIKAIFMAFGDSPSVLKLADQLTGELQLRESIGEIPNDSNEPNETNSIIVKLPLINEDDDSVFAQTQSWLEHHGSVIGAIDAQKIIEFHTFLDSNTGSRILTIPNALVSICGKLGLDIAIQAIRVLTRTEYETIRENKN
jgi:hypothetical protein